MTKKEIKTKARSWLTQIEKIISEHQTIEEGMDNPEQVEGFTEVGFALGALEGELKSLLES